jgi:hypothetical protein
MNPPHIECLYVGFDGLDVAFQGSLPEAALAMLERARDEAQREMRAVLVRIGELDAHVAETGARGGYRYRFDTGEDGETWFVKQDARVDRWNIRVSVKSLPLMLHGYAAVCDRLYTRLRAMGARVLAASIGRVDIAVDLRMHGFRLDPTLFVAHSHCDKDAQFDPDQDQFSVHYAGREPTSVTVGTMPGRQIIVYNKRREAIQKHKWYWFDRWGLDWKSDKEPVWRVEVRAGKTHLKDHWRITTFADLEATIADVVTNAMAKIRYLDPTSTGANVTRRTEHPLWARARNELLAHLGRLGISPSGVVPGRMITGKRSVLKHVYRRLITGLAASYAAVHDFHGEAAEGIATKIAFDIRSEINHDPRRFHRKVALACDRMALIEDEYVANCAGQPGTSI